ncbi:hypothetical protein KFL_003210090 [Klebsormidium nitens]|uniref:Uncharacterized protein n=1 Tax=Klebsormidium nitens TaxID=105231 RepID=A0A1Y1I8S0_KLENI|nr:hypothetical protein KFL_003210090 [Klebsormidium nitens]|eukprot:GAQ86933.1 hypothetical protein KFL_003210090 [Klebsormidium nitens]
MKAGITGFSMHTLTASDMEHWGLEPRVIMRAFCFIEGLLRKLDVRSFHRVHSAMTDDEFANVVDEASAAFENLKILGARGFVKMKPSEWAHFLDSEVLGSRLETAINQPKNITLVQAENMEKSVTVFGQEGLDKLISHSQYLILLGSTEEEEKVFVTKFWDLKNGERYTTDESVSRYEKLRRHLEQDQHQDSETVMNQAFLSLINTAGAAFLDFDPMEGTAPCLPGGQLDKGSSTLAQGLPMPVAHRVHLPTWRHGKRLYPQLEFDAVALIGFEDGRKAIVVGERKIHAIREDVLNLAHRAINLRARLLAGDPLLTTPTGRMRDKELYRALSSNLSPHSGLRFVPLLFAEIYDPEVKTSALENEVALLTRDGGAVDVVVPVDFDSLDPIVGTC